jgi:maleylacetate reductase
MHVGTHHWPAQERVIYGKPAVEAIAEEVARAKASRVYVTTTRSLTNGALVARIVESLGPKFVGKLDAIPAHSPRESVLAGADAFRERTPDLVIAVGGGSVIDATKVMLLAYWRGARTLDAVSQLAGARGPASDWHGDPHELRMVAIPTTLSAAEFFQSAGVTDMQRKVKLMFSHPLMTPRSVILDPAATQETPVDLMLSTGMRAVDHAVEGWCSTLSAPMADGANREAMRLLAQALPRIRRDAADMDARALSQHGMWLTRMATFAGIPFGASHGIGYLLGGGYGVPHGVTSCIMLPAVLTWNESTDAGRQADVAAAFGKPGERAGEAMRRFVESLGQPTRLRDVGIEKETLPAIAAAWDGKPPIATNPRKVRGKDDLLEILELAW